MENVIVVGSGGHAMVVMDILQASGKWSIVGVTSDSLEKDQIFNGYPVLGKDEVITEYKKKGITKVAMGLGGFKDNNLRKKVFLYVKSMGVSFVNAIHPSAVISETVKLGEGVVIFPGVILNTFAVIGNNTIVATGSNIDHQTIVEDHVLISAGVTVGAYATVKSSALLALGSKVVSGVIIGGNSVVGAGATVLSDVKDNDIVFGTPAKSKSPA